jgi:hypothetical protein
MLPLPHPASTPELPLSSLFSRLAIAPRPALLFGLAGLLPFVGLTLRAVWGPADAHTTALVALLQYGALIATFVGALHWGYAVAGVASTASAALRYGWSVVPSLVAWLALQQSLQTGLRLVAALLVACYLADRQLLRSASLPPWIADLRLLLTSVAAVSLAVASTG